LGRMCTTTARAQPLPCLDEAITGRTHGRMVFGADDAVLSSPIHLSVVHVVAAHNALLSFASESNAPPAPQKTAQTVGSIPGAQLVRQCM
jgi:hypothetical protein